MLTSKQLNESGPEFCPDILLNSILLNVNREKASTRSLVIEERCLKGSVLLIKISSVELLNLRRKDFISVAVDTIYRYNGDVISFSGSDLICAFLMDDEDTTFAKPVFKAFRTAWDLREHILRNDDRMDNDDMSVSFAITCGNVRFAQFGGVKNEWVFAMGGECVSQLGECIEEAVKSHEIVCSKECFEYTKSFPQVFDRDIPSLNIATSNSGSSYLQHADREVTNRDFSTSFPVTSFPTSLHISYERDATTDEMLSNNSILSSQRSSSLLELRNLKYLQRFSTTTDDRSYALEVVLEQSKLFIPRIISPQYSAAVRYEQEDEDFRESLLIPDSLIVAVRFDSYNPCEDLLIMQPVVVLLQTIAGENKCICTRVRIDHTGCCAYAIWDTAASFQNLHAALLFSVYLITRVAAIGQQCSVAIAAGEVEGCFVGSRGRRGDVVFVGDKLDRAFSLMRNASGRLLVDESVHELFQEDDRKLLIAVHEHHCQHAYCFQGIARAQSYFERMKAQDASSVQETRIFKAIDLMIGDVSASTLTEVAFSDHPIPTNHSNESLTGRPSIVSSSEESSNKVGKDSSESGRTVRCVQINGLIGSMENSMAVSIVDTAASRGLECAVAACTYADSSVEYSVAKKLFWALATPLLNDYSAEKRDVDPASWTLQSQPTPSLENPFHGDQEASQAVFKSILSRALMSLMLDKESPLQPIPDDVISSFEFTFFDSDFPGALEKAIKSGDATHALNQKSALVLNTAHAHRLMGKVFEVLLSGRKVLLLLEKGHHCDLCTLEFISYLQLHPPSPCLCTVILFRMQSRKIIPAQGASTVDPELGDGSIERVGKDANLIDIEFKFAGFDEFCIRENISGSLMQFFYHRFMEMFSANPKNFIRWRIQRYSQVFSEIAYSASTAMIDYSILTDDEVRRHIYSAWGRGADTAEKLDSTAMKKLDDLTHGRKSRWVEAVCATFTRAEVVEFIKDSAVPEDLTSRLIGYKLRRLSRRHFAALQFASVIGELFSQEIFGAILRFDGQYDSMMALVLFEDEQLIETVVEAPLHTYAFQSSYLREVLYGMLQPSERSSIHLSIAQHLETCFSDSIVPFNSIMSHHYFNAGDKPQKTLEYSIKAAEHEIKSEKLSVCLMLIRRALDLRVSMSAEEIKSLLSTVDRATRVLNGQPIPSSVEDRDVVAANDAASSSGHLTAAAAELTEAEKSLLIEAFDRLHAELRSLRPSEGGIDDIDLEASNADESYDYNPIKSSTLYPEASVNGMPNADGHIITYFGYTDSDSNSPYHVPYLTQAGGAHVKEPTIEQLLKRTELLGCDYADNKPFRVLKIRSATKEDLQQLGHLLDARMLLFIYGEDASPAKLMRVQRIMNGKSLYPSPKIIAPATRRDKPSETEMAETPRLKVVNGRGLNWPDKAKIGSIGVACFIYVMLFSAIIYAWTPVLANGVGNWGFSFITMSIAYITVLSCSAEIASSMPFNGGSYGLARVFLGFYPGFLVGAFQWLELMGYQVANLLSVTGTIVSYTQCNDGWQWLMWFSFYFASCLFVGSKQKLIFHINTAVVLGATVLVGVYLFGSIGYVSFHDNAPFMQLSNDDVASSNATLSESSSSSEPLATVPLMSVTSWFVNGMVGYMQSFSFATWPYGGSEAGLFLTACAQNPQRSVPYGMVYAGYALFVTTVLVGAVICSSPPGSASTALNLFSLDPVFMHIFPTLDDEIASSATFPFITISAVLQLFLAGLLVHSFSGSNLLPAVLSSSEAGFMMCLTATSVVGILTCAVMAFPSSINPRGSSSTLVNTLTNVGLLGGLFSCLADLIGFVRLRLQYPEFEREFRSPFGIPGALLSAALFILCFVGVGFYSDDDYAAISAFSSVFGLWTVYYFGFCWKKQTLSENEFECMFKLHVATYTRRRSVLRRQRPRPARNSVHASDEDDGRGGDIVSSKWSVELHKQTMHSRGVEHSAFGFV